MEWAESTGNIFVVAFGRIEEEGRKGELGKITKNITRGQHTGKELKEDGNEGKIGEGPNGNQPTNRPPLFSRNSQHFVGFQLGQNRPQQRQGRPYILAFAKVVGSQWAIYEWNGMPRTVIYEETVGEMKERGRAKNGCAEKWASNDDYYFALNSPHKERFAPLTFLLPAVRLAEKQERSCGNRVDSLHKEQQIERKYCEG